MGGFGNFAKSVMNSSRSGGPKYKTKRQVKEERAEYSRYKEQWEKKHPNRDFYE